MKLKILCWNVNGVRAVLKKGFLSWLDKESPDMMCLQETKAAPGQLPPELLHPDGYEVHWNWAQRPGYSGVATFTKEKTVAVKKSFGAPRFDTEGRMLETEFKHFTLFNIYFPNGKQGDERLQYKLDFYDAILKYFLKLKRQGKKLVICGDYNTAHKEVDLSRPKENEKISGFLPVERAWLDKLVASGFLDTFRLFCKDPGHYSWWDLRTGARKRNIGWRIDYHFISENLKPHLDDAFILPEVMGSDHCPVGITLKFK